MKGQREDEINLDIDRALSRLFSQANVLLTERPGHTEADMSIEAARKYLLDRLSKLEVHWSYLQSIYGSPGRGD